MVVGALAVVAASAVSFVEGGVKRGVSRRLVQLRPGAAALDRRLFRFGRTLYTTSTCREICRVEADLSGYLWYLGKQVDRHAVGRVEVDPQTVMETSA